MWYGLQPTFTPSSLYGYFPHSQTLDLFPTQELEVYDAIQSTFNLHFEHMRQPRWFGEAKQVKVLRPFFDLSQENAVLSCLNKQDAPRPNQDGGYTRLLISTMISLTWWRKLTSACQISYSPKGRKWNKQNLQVCLRPLRTSTRSTYTSN